GRSLGAAARRTGSPDGALRAAAPIRSTAPARPVPGPSLALGGSPRRRPGRIAPGRRRAGVLRLARDAQEPALAGPDSFSHSSGRLALRALLRPRRAGRCALRRARAP